MTAALEGGEWLAARPGCTLPPGKTRYPFYRRLGGPQGRSGRAENLVPTGIRSRTVQPIVSHYTDWATRPTHCICACHYFFWLCCHNWYFYLNTNKKINNVVPGVIGFGKQICVLLGYSAEVVIISCRSVGTTYRSHLQRSWRWDR